MKRATIIIDGTEYSIKAANARFPGVPRPTIEAAVKVRAVWSLVDLQALQAERYADASRARKALAAESEFRKGFRKAGKR